MRLFSLLFLSVMLSITVLAQNSKPTEKNTKSDIVLKVNGDEMVGKITAISDNEIKFVYEGETLEYSIKKTDILKVTYSSGRVEFFNRQPLPSEKKETVGPTPTADAPAKPARQYAVASGDHHNKIAILPFGYIRDGQTGAKEISTKIQTDAYSFLAKHSAGYTLLDTRTTNSLLIKAGVTRDNLEGYTWDEICNILGVEYVIDGTVNIVKGMQSSNSNSSFNASSDNNNKSYNSGNTKAFGSTSSYSAQYYETSVNMNVFNDKNQNIYTENHKAFLNSTNAQYNTTLQYLLKRIPLYRK
jgi:hypothetical protein